MAKLPPYASFRALEISERLTDGRTAEALDMVIADLQAGCADEQVQWIAANLLRPSKKARGAPRKTGPKQYLDIGAAFENALIEGKPWDVAREDLASEFGVSESHAENCLAAYRRGTVAP